MGGNPPPDPLARLAEQLERAKQQRRREEMRGHAGAPPGAMGLALRMAIELAAALCVGLALGWVFDRLLGTRPWGLIVFFFLGVAAGMLNVFRAAKGVGYKGMYPAIRDNDRSKQD